MILLARPPMTAAHRAFLKSVAKTGQPPDGWRFRTGRSCLLRDWVTFRRVSLQSWEWSLTPAGQQALEEDAIETRGEESALAHIHSFKGRRFATNGSR